MGRGQVSNPMILVHSVVAVVVVAIVILVGMDIAHQFANAAAFEPAAEPPIGPPPSPWSPVPSLAVIFASVAIAVAVGGVTLSIARVSGDTASGELGAVDRLKEDYVAGELDLHEFEDRVYDEIEVKI